MCLTICRGSSQGIEFWYDHLDKHVVKVVKSYADSLRGYWLGQTKRGQRELAKCESNGQLVTTNAPQFKALLRAYGVAQIKIPQYDLSKSKADFEKHRNNYCRIEIELVKPYLRESRRILDDILTNPAKKAQYDEDKMMKFFLKHAKPIADTIQKEFITFQNLGI